MQMMVNYLIINVYKASLISAFLVLNDANTWSINGIVAKINRYIQ